MSERLDDLYDVYVGKMRDIEEPPMSQEEWEKEYYPYGDTHMTIYEDNGYEDREDYLRCLAEDNEVDYSTVRALADVLGENEDFDGLVTSVQDVAQGYM